MTAAAPIRRAWLVANAGSGSTEADGLDWMAAALAGQGAEVVGKTDFPDEPLPDASRLDAARADTLMICAGDGTINAAVVATGDWGGQCLVLPGGTMNGLAKALHGDAAREAIVQAAAGATLVHPPTANAEGRTALVGVILGPAASWVHAREGVRKGRFARAIRAARIAWARSFGRTIRVAGAPGHHRAVIVTPRTEGLDYATISTAGVSDAIRLGWNWLLGDWRSDAGVSVAEGAEVTLVGHRFVRALFDGEPAKLETPACIRHGQTRLAFLATAPAE
ncbi:acylglycerol kinase family protein [Sphingosinicellaceae bacterium]|nr:acylglycerol kinase family protein [Sphingosinicellaceae bacterium]